MFFAVIFAAMNYEKLKNHFVLEVEKSYGKKEAENMFWWALSFNEKWNKITFELKKVNVLSEIDLIKWNKIISRLKKHEPIQYILGLTEFYGLEFNVNPSTLIPRPETEELVDMIIKNHTGKEISVLDIGTGSGCIAVSLAKNLKGAFTAMDVDLKTIETAKENAALNGVDVQFLVDDILNPQLNYPKYDVIVSNPPYIPETDKSEMAENVLDFEPHLALFVKDENPLLFYDAIFNFAQNHLKENGVLYFEIHPSYHKQLKVKLKHEDYRFEFYDDLQGRKRMLKITTK